MKMTFIGATHEVTGSCTYINACGKHFLIDFGMEQGANMYENIQIPVAPSQIDFVLLTHAHIDHSGLLPLLYAGGFTGDIHSTVATAHLCDIMLRDSAHIQEFEAEWRNRKGKRKGDEEFLPLYTMEDAIGAISRFKSHKYDTPIEICDGISVRFIDAGHLLGSSSIEITMTENDVSKKIVFSGDIGNSDQPLIRDPQPISKADYVVMESTYGNRNHDKRIDYITSLTQIIQRTFDRGGNVIIPSFAVGRTQEMLYFIRQIKNENLIKGHDDFPVYVDSPLAIEATNIFLTNREHCFDEEALAFVKKGVNPIGFQGLIKSVSSDDSRAINFDPNPKIIISASGMCEAGRIKHHLKHNLWKKENTILFVGYQAANTLGRSLLNGAKKVKLFGESVYVFADICQLPGISGHADFNGLINWVKNVDNPSKVFLNHGDHEAIVALSNALKDNLNLDVYSPYSGAEFDLATNEITVDARPIEIQQKTNFSSSPTYNDLLMASDRLYALIKENKGRANQDMRNLTEKINKLCDEWKL